MSGDYWHFFSSKTSTWVPYEHAKTASRKLSSPWIYSQKRFIHGVRTHLPPPLFRCDSNTTSLCWPDPWKKTFIYVLLQISKSISSRQWQRDNDNATEQLAKKRQFFGGVTFSRAIAKIVSSAQLCWQAIFELCNRISSQNKKICENVFACS